MSKINTNYIEPKEENGILYYPVFLYDEMVLKENLDNKIKINSFDTLMAAKHRFSRLVFRYGFLNIYSWPKANNYITGMLYSMSEEVLKRLDYHYSPLYTKKIDQFINKYDKVINAYTYVMTIPLPAYQLPTNEYTDNISYAYKEVGLNDYQINVAWEHTASKLELI